MNQIEADATGIKATLERMERDRSMKNTTTIRIEGGGVGTWIAVTCCAVMLAVAVILVPIGAAAYIELRGQIRALDDSDNAIRAYINTGILKPKPERDDNAH